MEAQFAELAAYPDILVATPGERMGLCCCVAEVPHIAILLSVQEGHTAGRCDHLAVLPTGPTVKPAAQLPAR